VACEGVRREGPADRPRAPVQEDPQDRGEAQIELGKVLELARAGRQRTSPKRRAAVKAGTVA
jgi:hypothetical protein